MIKTTKKHFKLFKKECKKWQNKWELNHWDISYQWENLDDCGFDMGASWTFKDYHAIVKLDTEIDESNMGDISLNQLVKDTAKHEMIHVLLGKIFGLAADRYISSPELGQEEERLVRQLEKLL